MQSGTGSVSLLSNDIISYKTSTANTSESVQTISMQRILKVCAQHSAEACQFLTSLASFSQIYSPLKFCPRWRTQVVPEVFLAKTRGKTKK